MNTDKIIAIIPARGGSKSIPNKNNKRLGNYSLIYYPIKIAKKVEKIDRIIVSTDSNKIANIAKKHGAEIPFIRPEKLSQDDTPTLPVLQHCLNFLKNNENYQPDIVLLLYPTCPFLTSQKVEEALSFFKDSNCQSVISVTKEKGRFWKLQQQKQVYLPFYPPERINRQYYPPLYKENGAIYFSRYEVLMKKNKLIDENNTKFIIMNKDEIIDIDTPKDWEKAEELLKNEN